MPPAKNIRVTNWDFYQHYSDRNPPWIKLHVKLLDNHEAMTLPVASRWLAVALLLIAARSNNVIAVDVPWLARESNMTPSQTERGLKDLLRCRFVEPIGRKRGASSTLDEGKPSRAGTRSASASVSSSEGPRANDLVAHYVDEVKRNGDHLPDRIKGQTAKQIALLLRDDTPADLIRKALTLQADKGTHPSVLPALVMEAQRANGRNGRGLTSAEILAFPIEELH